MTTCPHDLTEREVACADGMCPQCLAAECDALRECVRLTDDIRKFWLAVDWSAYDKARAKVPK